MGYIMYLGLKSFFVKIENIEGAQCKDKFFIK